MYYNLKHYYIFGINFINIFKTEIILRNKPIIYNNNCKYSNLTNLCCKITIIIILLLETKHKPK